MTETPFKPDLFTNPEPGIYPGIPFADYAKIPAMNCSTLRWGEASMRHLKAAMDGHLKRDDSADLRFGRAFHIRVLEPERYAESVIVRGPCEAILKSGPRKGGACGSGGAGMIGGAWYCGTHGGDSGSD